MSIRVMLVATVVFLAFSVGVSSMSRAALAGEETGTVRGVIFWDRDANGEQDEDEPGIPTNPTLASPDGGMPVVVGSADDEGHYEIDAEAGTYRLSPGIATSFEQCAGAPLPSYWPFGFRDCVGADYPITSDPLTEPFDLAAGETVEIDFPVTTRDEMILLARAIVDRGNAPAGSVVTALFEGTECGTATIPEAGSPGGGPGDFVLRVLGAGERSGCPEQFDQVPIVMDGLTASILFEYTPFSPVPNSQQHYGRDGVGEADLDFLEDYMWVWSDGIRFEDGSNVSSGTPVRAMFGDVVCGETVIGDISSDRGEVPGFGRLFVASAALQPGCGAPGAEFEIRIGATIVIDGASGIPLMWAPKLFQVGSGVERASPGSLSPADPCPPAIGAASPPLSPPVSEPLSPPFAEPLSPPDALEVVTALQEVPASPPQIDLPISPPPGELPLSPPQLSPPESPPSIGRPVCPDSAPAGVAGPDTGMGTVAASRANSGLQLAVVLTLIAGSLTLGAALALRTRGSRR